MTIQVSTNREEAETQEAEDEIQEEEEDQILLYIALFAIDPAMQKKIISSKENRDATNVASLVTSPKTVDRKMYNKPIR